jgi:hypothetical protein
MESISASVRPVTALVAPGPEVTRATPTVPVERGVALGRVDGGLLVPHQDVADVVLLEELVVDGETAPPG